MKSCVHFIASSRGEQIKQQGKNKLLLLKIEFHKIGKHEAQTRCYTIYFQNNTPNKEEAKNP